VLRIAAAPTDIDLHVAAFRPAQLMQLLPEHFHPSLIFRVVFGSGHEHADAPHRLGMLRARP
jgi:hypothetical protein